MFQIKFKRDLVFTVLQHQEIFSSSQLRIDISRYSLKYKIKRSTERISKYFYRKSKVSAKKGIMDPNLMIGNLWIRHHMGL